MRTNNIKVQLHTRLCMCLRVFTIKSIYRHPPLCHLSNNGGINGRELYRLPILLTLRYLISMLGMFMIVLWSAFLFIASSVVLYWSIFFDNGPVSPLWFCMQRGVPVLGSEWKCKSKIILNLKSKFNYKQWLKLFLN